MRSWLEVQCWSEVYIADSASTKAKVLQDMLVKSYKNFFPEKTQRVNSDEQPWISFKLKAMDRRRKREYNKHRTSDKWHTLDKDFKQSVKVAKKNFLQKSHGRTHK